MVKYYLNGCVGFKVALLPLESVATMCSCVAVGRLTLLKISPLQFQLRLAAQTLPTMATSDRGENL